MPKHSKPCSDCPWRRDAPVGHWHPDHFEQIWHGCQDDGMEIMLCHKAAKLPEAERKNLPCRGWILVMGFAAIGVRLLMSIGRITPSELEPTPKCPELYESFEAMVLAQGLEPPPRNKYVPLHLRRDRGTTG